MNSGATAERVYDALRRRVMAHEFRPGDRLDPATLAAELVSSATPVRDALHRLTGEGLVETRLGGGFFLPALDQPLLTDLYAWSAQLVLLALRGWPRADQVVAVSAAPEVPVAEHTGMVFAAIARQSTNSEHARAVARLNARLQAIRMVEPQVLGSVSEELAEWWPMLASGDRAALRGLCKAYHRRRIRAAGPIVRAVYRTS